MIYHLKFSFLIRQLSRNGFTNNLSYYTSNREQIDLLILVDTQYITMFRALFAR